jgi:adenylate cyclase
LKVERKLAAILAADVVGYTGLMGSDEAGTLRRVTDLRETVLAPLISEHHGRIVKLMGDGLLVDFASAVDCVACAVAWQNRVAQHEAELDAGRALQFRIGINLGDVIVEDGDIHGDGVNIAARLESLAQPGGICLSDDVYRHTKGKIEARFEDIGEQKLKNVADAVRAYNVVPRRSALKAPVLANEPRPPIDKPSIAVLPFENISSGNEHEFLADGMTEEIITTLSKISGLFVIARNSVLAYKDRAVDAREVGRQLAARYLLEGSVRRGGERVRISAQLVEAAAGHHVWARRFDRQVDDIFALQDELTKEIVSALQVELTEGEQARLAASNTRNFEAWQLAFEGRDLVHLHRKDSVRKGRRLLEQATALDPNYAFAWGSLAEAHWKEAANEGWSESPQRSFDMALEASDKALALDPEDAVVLSMRSVIMVTTHEFDSALALARKALRSAHSEANALALATITLRCCGLAEEALRQLELAKRYCRIYPAWYPYNEALCHWILRQADEAIAALNHSIGIDPDFSLAYALLAAIHVENGNDEDARKAADQLLRTDPLFSAKRYTESRPFRDPDLTSRLRNAMRKVGLPD